VRVKESAKFTIYFFTLLSVRPVEFFFSTGFANKGLIIIRIIAIMKIIMMILIKLMLALPALVIIIAATNMRLRLGGSVAKWLACWTQAQKVPGSNCSRDAVG